MIRSMTGFAAKEIKIEPYGKISVELRSINHKFLETVLHMPEGFLSMEENIKKLIEAKIKRGRINCVLTFSGTKPSEVYINKPLIKNYMSALSSLRKQFGIRQDLTLDTLVRLPGVISLSEETVSATTVWPHIRKLVVLAVEELSRARKDEGKALCAFLKTRANLLKSELEKVKVMFKHSTSRELCKIKTDDQKSGFLRDTDITEEIERLSFHIKNFIKRLSTSEAVGKELDFIAQEMQRETNTAGAKTCDASISAKVVELRSQIEKIREQLQNVE